MKHLEFKDRFGDLLKSGKKRATIRLKCNLKKGDEVFVHCGGKIIGTAEITDVIVKGLNELDEEDAKEDGFDSREELLREIKRLYGNPEKVCIIKFKFKEFKSEVTPHKMYYGDEDLVEMAKRALEHLNLSERDRKILQIFVRTRSIRKTALKLGGIRKRGVVRKVLRSCIRELKKRG